MATHIARYRVRSVSDSEWTNALSGRSYPLYYALWWLRPAASRGELLLYICYKDETHPVAVMAAMMRHGQIVPPAYTQYTGIYFLDESVEGTTRQAVMKLIMDALPPCNYLHLQCPPDSGDHLAYHWSGYRETTRYNYIWDIRSYPTSDLLLSSISLSLRRNVRSAQRAGFVYTSEVSLQEALQMLSFSSEYKGYQLDLHTLRQLLDAVQSLGLIYLVGVRSPEGELALVSMLVEHQRTLYLIAEGTDRTVTNRHLKTLLLCGFISEHPLKFDFIDFEGSMLEPIVQIYQGLGAIQQAYHSIWKGTRRNLFYLGKKFLDI